MSPEGARPAVQRLGRAVLLQESGVTDAAFLVRVGIAALRQRDDIPPQPTWLVILRELRAAELSRASAVGNAEVPDVESQREWESESIDTKEASRMLQVSERQVRNLAANLSARRVGSSWTFDRSLVAAEARRRRALTEGMSA